jgi:hypothetical protein
MKSLYELPLLSLDYYLLYSSLDICRFGYCSFYVPITIMKSFCFEFETYRTSLFLPEVVVKKLVSNWSVTVCGS